MSKRPMDLSDFWKDVPLGGRLLFYGAVFFTFAVMGFVTDLMGGARTEPRLLALFVLYSGSFAIVIAWAAVNRNWWVMVAGVGAGFFVPSLLRHLGTDATGVVSRPRLMVTALGIAFLIVAGYLFFISFISVEGRRYVRAHGELAIAAEVHRSVVPILSLEEDGWEWWGRSEPSGQVGGDLVDLVPTPAGRVGYVVDVAGHAIGAGVLMAMAKSAGRAHLRFEGSLAGLLQAWNDTLAGLLDTNRFATCAVALATPDGRVELGLAGHVPAIVIRENGGAVEEYRSEDPPLGILPGRDFTSRTVRMAPGDLLVLLTDGFTEVESRRGVELGLRGVMDVLDRESGRGLPEIFEAVREAALRHGRQTDDQTMLLLRRKSA